MNGKWKRVCFQGKHKRELEISLKQSNLEKGRSNNGIIELFIRMNWILTEGCKGQGHTRLRNKHEQRCGLVNVHGVAWAPGIV